MKSLPKQFVIVRSMMDSCPLESKMNDIGGEHVFGARGGGGVLYL